jgi:hypothetical protein
MHPTPLPQTWVVRIGADQKAVRQVPGIAIELRPRCTARCPPRPLLKWRMSRTFYQAWEISPAVSAELEAHVQLPSDGLGLQEIFRTPSG